MDDLEEITLWRRDYENLLSKISYLESEVRRLYEELNHLYEQRSYE